MKHTLNDDTEAEDDGIYGVGDVYEATSDFWAGSEEETTSRPSISIEPELSSEETPETN